MPFVLFGLALAWTVMLLFGGLDFDRGLLVALYAGDRPNLAFAARFVTELGGSKVLLPATAAGAAWLLYKRQFRAAALLLLLSLGGRGLVELQKAWVARIRPEEFEHLVATHNLSFPSGHAANGTIVWFSLAFLLTSRFPHRAAALWAAAWLALLIGASRVMLGVHWPSDVIGGWAFGLLWTLLLLRLSGHDLSDGTRHRPPPVPAPPTSGASGGTAQ
jgi:membrane-associated phospholipid phosphatase